MIDQTLFDSMLAKIWDKLPDYWYRHGVMGALVEGVAWVWYRVRLLVREIPDQIHIATADDDTVAIGLRPREQPRELSGLLCIHITGFETGEYTLAWDAANGLLSFGEYAPVHIPRSGKYDLVSYSTDEDALDYDAKAAARHCWIKVDCAKTPSLSHSETVRVDRRYGFDFLGHLGGLRNRPRYEDEETEHYRTRLKQSPGRGVSTPAAESELADFVGYTPDIEERTEEWSGFLIPGLSHIGYRGWSTNAIPGILQERFRGAHARDRSDVNWHVWLHLAAEDVDKDGIDDVFRRTFAAETKVEQVGDRM